jgi:hypothetical protein
MKQIKLSSGKASQTKNMTMKHQQQRNQRPGARWLCNMAQQTMLAMTRIIMKKKP